MPPSSVRNHAIAAAWGAAEATFFFIVPDVWISKVALRKPREAAALTASALAGAVVGGLATRAWSARTPPETSERLLARLPAVSHAMVRQVRSDMQRDGLRAMLRGPVRGIPYKLYARAAGLDGSSVGEFVAWSVPARLPRFLILAVLPGAFASTARRRGASDRMLDLIHAGAWTAFYIGFFRRVGRDEVP